MSSDISRCHLRLITSAAGTGLTRKLLSRYSRAKCRVANSEFTNTNNAARARLRCYATTQHRHAGFHDDAAGLFATPLDFHFWHQQRTGKFLGGPRGAGSSFRAEALDGYKFLGHGV